MIMRRIIGQITHFMYLAYARLGYWLGGIDFVCRLVANAPQRCIAPLLRSYGAVVGAGTRFKDGLLIDNASGDQDATNSFRNLVIGKRCYIGKDCFFDLPDRIVLEDEVVVSVGVRMLTHADCGSRVMSLYYPRQRAPIHIGFGTWIGAGATLLCGVELGACCVVATGAVVTESFPDYSVVAGVPARIIKKLPENAGSI